MNASVRRVFACQGRQHSSRARAASSRARRHASRRLLFAGLVGFAPVIATAAAPTAPSPPMLPVAEKPASTSLFSKPVKPATPAAGAPAAAAQASAAPAGGTPKTAATATSAPAKGSAAWSWNPVTTVTGLFKPTASAAAPGQPRGAADPRGPAQATGQTTSQPTDQRPNTSAAAASTAGSPRRFDPDFGPAGLVVSDGAATRAAGGPTPQDDADFLASAPAFPATPAAAPEPGAKAEAKEPVNLVSWLSQSYSELVSGEGYDGYDGTAEAGSGVCVTDCCCPTWQVQVDALFFWQGNIPSRPLYVYTDTLETALDANQLQTRAAIAPRYAVIYNRDDCRAVEVNYFAAWGFNAYQQVGSPEFPVLDESGNGALSSVGLLGKDIDGIGLVQASSSAHIKSFEANLRRRQEDGFVQWISGFRWLEWGQGLSLQDTIYTPPPATGAPPGTLTEFYAVSTLNNLYGWQLGGDATLWNAGRWVRINGVGKAGIYYNHQALQNSAYLEEGKTPENFSEAKDAVSFVGETGINASVSLTKWLSWRLGYSFFWLGGVATPARQLNQTDFLNGTTAVNTTGSVFLQAATTGLEARW